MKKNKTMRLASGLLVAVLLTTCAISGTFAKYTTSAQADDSARVAKWGVTVAATGDEAFAKKYNDAADDAGTKVVSSDKVVAPGTNGNLASLEVSGTTEVMVDITATADLELVGWEISSVEYCPIVITVGTDEFKMTSTVADFETEVEEAVVNALNKTNVAPGTNLADSIAVTWAWAYEGNDDLQDTELGKLAEAGTAPNIAFECSITVTQVD